MGEDRTCSAPIGLPEGDAIRQSHLLAGQMRHEHGDHADDANMRSAIACMQLAFAEAAGKLPIAPVRRDAVK